VRTSVPGILVAGDAAGISDVATAIAEGRFAGLSAADALGLLPDEALDEARTAYHTATGNRAAIAASLSPVPTHV
jgi:heterodisulfide reductase subunit A-like polyferredoxin